MLTFKKKEDNITLCKFNSSTIIQSVYYHDKEFLYIFFKKGNVYSYKPIKNEMYEQFEKANSQGKYLAQNVKNNTSIIYRKETKLKEEELKSIIEDKF